MNKEKLAGIIENILFMAGEAVKLKDLAALLDIELWQLKELIAEEQAKREQGYGLLLRQYDDAVQLCTRPEYAPVIVELLGEKNEEELTRAAMETLSIIAYRQPVTRDEVEKVRGVGSSYTINALLEKDLIRVAGRKEALGRPKLYATTPAFLKYFDIESLEELPPLPEEEQPEEIAMYPMQNGEGDAQE